MILITTEIYLEEVDPAGEINLTGQIKEKDMIQVDTDPEVVKEDLDPEIISITEMIVETAIEAQVEKDGEKVRIQDQDLDQDSEIM